MLGAVAKVLIGAILGVLFLIAMALAYAHDLLSEESRAPKAQATDSRKQVSMIDEART
ncbi:MAG TPA: hypothetical protein VNQ81_07620 [Povalibacter sp.]|nr:hypothetical protein [Povalibacter sp.]